MFGWITKRFKKEPTEIKEGFMHDFRNCCWGHAISFNGEGKLPNSRKVYGWASPTVNKGDTFLLEATKGLAVWMFIEVKNCDDPRDMFFATVGITRYATDEDIEKAGHKKTGFQMI